MFCEHCGKQIPDNVMFCPHCDAQVTRAQQAPHVEEGHFHEGLCDTSYPTVQAKPSVGFVEAITLFFKNYVNFSGRSRRSEYWWVVLFNMIAGALITAILPDLAGLWSLAVLLPGIALCIRRLHDVGKSGWWYLLIFIPLVGSILLLVFFCTDSAPDNQWGPNPKY